MKVATLLVLLFWVLPPSVFTSKCVVTKWREWSACVGNCEFALRVRNRDVIRPPFPEKTKSGSLAPRQECPPLYETENCIPKECEEVEIENPFSELRKHFPLPQYHDNRRKANSTTKTEGSVQKTTIEGRSKISGTSLFLSNYSTPVNRIKCGREQNELCCRVSRNVCPDGTRPKLLTRWYRQDGSNICRPYDYPYCGLKYESVEQPASSEEACIDLCFTPAEKTILPTLRLI